MRKNKNDIDIYAHLTQEELLDYNQGVLGTDEMYRLELHLNECEFCHDALEGMALSKNATEELNQLSKALFPAQKETFSFNYRAVAASIALIAVAGLSYWLISSPDQKKVIAINTPEEIIPEEPELAVAEKQTTEVEVDASLEQENNEEEELPNTSSTQGAATTAKPVDRNSGSSKQKSRIRQKEVEPIETTGQLATIPAQEQPVQADQTTIEESIIESDDGDTEISLSEVAATPNRSKKVSSKSTPALKNQKEPLPVGGMSALKAYTDKNIKYPKKASDNNIKGTVVLEVSINTDGSINNISVIKGLGYGCDAEAMRLISTGPNWLPKVENSKAVRASKQVKIKFKK